MELRISVVLYRSPKPALGRDIFFSQFRAWSFLPAILFSHRTPLQAGVGVRHTGFQDIRHIEARGASSGEHRCEVEGLPECIQGSVAV